MVTNKIVSIFISMTSIVVIPVQIITTFVLGILVSLSFGLLLLPISLIWIVFFYGPLLGLSYLFERIVFIRPIISVLGIPISVLGDTYVALMPSMGEMDSRLAKMVICQTFPYTWRFIQFQNNKLNIGKDDVLTKILREVSTSKPLSKYLDNLRADVYSRPEYMNGKYELDW